MYLDIEQQAQVQLAIRERLKSIPLIKKEIKALEGVLDMMKNKLENKSFELTMTNSEFTKLQEKADKKGFTLEDYINQLLTKDLEEKE